MNGDEITTKLRGTNAVSIPFADIITKLVDNNNRPWEVRVEGAGTNKASRFIASKEKVVLILNASSFGGDLHRFDVFENGALVQYDIPAKLVAT